MIAVAWIYGTLIYIKLEYTNWISNIILVSYFL
jgi:hypothetical protein